MVNVFSALIIQQGGVYVVTHQEGENWGYELRSGYVDDPGIFFKSSAIYLTSRAAQNEGERVVEEVRQLDLRNPLKGLAALAK